MNNFKKIGSISAFIEAAAYMIGIIFFVGVLNYSETNSAIEKLMLINQHKTSVTIVYFLIYILFGIFLVPLSLAFYDAIKGYNRLASQLILSFGLIWAGLVIASGMIFNLGIHSISGIAEVDMEKAAIIFNSFSVVTEGIGGGNEIIGGLFTFLISVTAIKYKLFSTITNYIGFFVGIAGILSTVPALSDITISFFGLGQIIWFVFIGINFIKQNKY